MFACCELILKISGMQHSLHLALLKHIIGFSISFSMICTMNVYMYIHMNVHTQYTSSVHIYVQKCVHICTIECAI